MSFARALSFVMVLGGAPPLSVPLDPQPTGDFTFLCRGPWMRADQSAPFRGVVASEDNGGGRCCDLEGTRFVCIMQPGHQHGPFVFEHARFYEHTGATPLEIPIAVSKNPGMAAAAIAAPIAALEPAPAKEGFVLRARPKGACARPPPEAAGVCRAAGAWTMRGGRPAKRAR